MLKKDKENQPKQYRRPSAKGGAKNTIKRGGVNSLRGRLKDKGLLKALMTEKKREREL